MEARSFSAVKRCDQLQAMGVIRPLVGLLMDDSLEVRERATTVMHNVDCSNDMKAQEAALPLEAA